jgi:Uma2 family endonuclease
LDRGFEPDQCFWVANWEKVRGAYFLWHPDHQPPPDLVVEIEVSRTAVNKLDLFAAYRIPEVWRFDGTTLRVHTLRPEGGYQEVAASPTFPNMPLADVPRFLDPDAGREIVAFIRTVRAWVRQWATA